MVKRLKKKSKYREGHPADWDVPDDDASAQPVKRPASLRIDTTRDPPPKRPTSTKAERLAYWALPPAKRDEFLLRWARREFLSAIPMRELAERHDRRRGAEKRRVQAAPAALTRVATILTLVQRAAGARPPIAARNLVGYLLSKWADADAPDRKTIAADLRTNAAQLPEMYRAHFSSTQRK
jgi:hypothetical protein